MLAESAPEVDRPSGAARRWLGRGLVTAGFSIGSYLVLAWVGGPANADDGGLLGNVASPVTSVVEPLAAPIADVVAPVTEPVADVVAPVTEPVTEVTQPLAETVVTPLAETVVTPLAETVVAPLAETVLAPLAETVAAAAAPLIAVAADVASPVTDVVSSVLEPVVAPAESFVAAVAGVLTPVAAVLDPPRAETVIGSDVSVSGGESSSAAAAPAVKPWFDGPNRTGASGVQRADSAGLSSAPAVQATSQGMPYAPSTRDLTDQTLPAPATAPSSSSASAGSGSGGVAVGIADALLMPQLANLIPLADDTVINGLAAPEPPHSPA